MGKLKTIAVKKANRQNRFLSRVWSSHYVEMLNDAVGFTNQLSELIHKNAFMLP